MFNPDLLKDKVAFISGGTSGINLGIAQAFVRHGARVCVIGRNPERGEAAVATLTRDGGEVIFAAADVRDPEAVEASVQRTVEAFGPLDIAIAGAAGNFFAPAISINPKGFRTVVEIDLLGTFHVFRSAFDHRNPAGASLIAITAGQAVNPMPFQAHVCAAKAGVNALLKTLAMEWGPADVRVNGISPGPIADTEGMKRLAPNAAAEQEVVRHIPLRRLGSVDDIANAALYLCSPLAGYVTGAIFDIEGGFQLGDAAADCLTPTR